MMETVRVALRPVSGLCNYHCGYCIFNETVIDRKTKSFGPMTTETLEQVIRKTLSGAVKEYNLTFQGGEPMMAGLPFYRRVVEYETCHNVHGASVHNTIQTNGSFVDEEWARFFTANDFAVEVSLDGIKSCHDHYRKDYMNHDTFAATVKRISLLNRYKTELTILTSVNNLTVDCAGEIYAFYKKKNWKSLDLVPCIGASGGQGQAYILEPKRYGSFLKQLFDLWYEDLRKGQYVYIRYFADLVLLLQGHDPSGCGLGGSCRKQYVVEPNGAVYPCGCYVREEYRLGNLMTDDLKDLDRRRTEIRFIEDSMEITKQCSGCPWYPLCRNGCRRHREAGGYPGTTVFCEAYRDFLSYTGKRLACCLKI